MSRSRCSVCRRAAMAITRPTSSVTPPVAEASRSSHEVALAGISPSGAQVNSTRFGNCGQIFEARMDRSLLPLKKLMIPDSAQVQTSFAPASK